MACQDYVLLGSTMSSFTARLFMPCDWSCVLWSLPVEMHYSLVLPLLLYASKRVSATGVDVGVFVVSNWMRAMPFLLGEGDASPG